MDCLFLVANTPQDSKAIKTMRCTIILSAFAAAVLAAPLAQTPVLNLPAVGGAVSSLVVDTEQAVTEVVPVTRPFTQSVVQPATKGLVPALSELLGGGATSATTTVN